MLPDPLFWYGLALKMAMTATIVVIASVAVERSGPFVGALIAALPTAAGAAYIITGATLVWFACAAALRLVDWTAPGALLLNALVFAITIPASARYRRTVVPREKIKRARYDLPLRAATAALVVAVVTTASHEIGSFASGTFAVFPIVMGSFVVILHPRVGGPAAGAVLAHAEPALVGLGLGFLGLHYLVEPLGVWWGFAGGLAIAMAWSVMLWLLRRARVRA
jgi:hypothetical protein